MLNIFNHARLIEHGSISKGCLHIVTPPSQIKKKGATSPPPSGSSAPPPPSRDTRTESYLKLAANRRAGGSAGTVNIDPNTLVQGEGQVAIQGGGSVVYNQPTQPNITSNPYVQVNEVSASQASSALQMSLRDTDAQGQPINYTLLERNGLHDTKSNQMYSRLPAENRQPSENNNLTNNPNRPVNTIEAAPPPSDKFRSLSDQYSFKAFREKDTFKKFGYESAAFGVSFFGTISKPVRNPKAFLVENFNFYKSVITDPSGTFGDVGQSILTNPGGFTGEFLGNLALGKGTTKIIEASPRITFIGKTQIEVTQIVEPEIITGQKRFPTSSKSAPALVNEFKNTPYQKPIKNILGENTIGGFSASPSALSVKSGVQAGTSATPGLYIAPSLSKYFLKITGESPETKLSLFPKISQPSINYIITDVGLIPGSTIKAAEVKSGLKIGAGGQRSIAGQPVRLPGGGYTPQAQIALLELNKYFGFRNAKIKLGGGGAVGDLTNQGGLPGSGKAAISPEYYLGKGEKEALVGFNSGLNVQKTGYNFWERVTGFKYYSVVDGKKVKIRIIEAQSKNPSASKVSALAEDLRTKSVRKSIQESYQRPYKTVSVYEVGLSRAAYTRYIPAYSNINKELNSVSLIQSARSSVSSARARGSSKAVSYRGSSLKVLREYEPALSTGQSNGLPSGSSGGLSGLSERISASSYKPDLGKPNLFYKRIGGVSGRLTIREFQGKSKTRYTPSFTALIFNIRGNPKKTKLSKSGLDFRPIPKGYNITKFK